MRRSNSPADLATVFVIDPDPALGRMIEEGTNLACEKFCSAREFFADGRHARPGCLVLDSMIPDMGGLQIQRRLAAYDSLLPLVFVASRTDVSTAVELMRRGAVHVLEKPVRPIDLLGALQEALAINAARRQAAAQQRVLRERIAALTWKERQVLGLVAQGKSAKAMSAALGLCPRAVELRRRRLMEKLDLETPLELMRFSIVACDPNLPQVEYRGAEAVAVL
jgi:two-component system response regulator FixJ